MSTASLLPGAALLSGVALLLAVIGWRDARHFTVELTDCLLLLVLSAGLKLIKDDALERVFAEALFALAVGIGCAVVIPASRRFYGRAWLCPGDVWLFCAFAFLLGPRGFAIAAIVNLPLAFGWRLWRLRNKPLSQIVSKRLFASYAPVAPAFCLATALVLLHELVTQLAGGFQDVG